MARQKILRSADLQVYINGQLFAICTGFRFSEDFGRHDIYGIDQDNPFELAPGQSSVSGGIDCVRLRRDGGIEGYGVAAPQSVRLLEKYFSLAVVDRSTDTIIFVVDDAAVTNQTWQVTAKGELTGSFMFKGITWSNESIR